MATTREEILERLRALLHLDTFFPDPEIDAPEPTLWRPDMDEAGGLPGILPARMWDASNVADGPVSVTRDAGDEDSCELMLSCAIAYVCASPHQSARRARRDDAAVLLEALIADDRTLGLDPQVYARIASADRDDKVAIRHAVPVAAIIINIEVDYVAASPAG